MSPSGLLERVLCRFLPPDFKAKERLPGWLKAIFKQHDKCATVSFFHVCWFPTFPFPEVYFATSVNPLPSTQAPTPAFDLCYHCQDD